MKIPLGFAMVLSVGTARSGRFLPVGKGGPVTLRPAIRSGPGRRALPLRQKVGLCLGLCHLGRVRGGERVQFKRGPPSETGPPRPRRVHVRTLHPFCQYIIGHGYTDYHKMSDIIISVQDKGE